MTTLTFEHIDNSSQRLKVDLDDASSNADLTERLEEAYDEQEIPGQFDAGEWYLFDWPSEDDHDLPLNDKFIDTDKHDNHTIADNYYDWRDAKIPSTCNADAFMAAKEIGLTPDSVDEAYQGKYSSGADFAEQIANDIYTIETHWPYNHINWEAAAEELEGTDYIEHEGHWFRNI